MFEGILLIIRKVIFFSLFSFAILELVPKDEYKKYINLFTGLVLILIIISPLHELLRDGAKTSGMIDRYLLENEMKDYDMYFEEYDEMRVEEVVGEYRNEIIQNISDMIESEQLAVNQIQVELNTDVKSEDFLKVMSVTAYVAQKYSEESIKIREIVLAETENTESIAVVNIKNKISQFYNVKTDNINIIK